MRIIGVDLQRDNRRLRCEAETSSIANAGGGRYVGIVNAIREKMESIILFVSPQTRTTLGIPISRLTVEAVRERLAESDAANDGTRTLAERGRPSTLRA